MAELDWSTVIRPHDPVGILDLVAEEYRALPDEQITLRLQMAVERLRNAMRSMAPEANITDKFEGFDAAVAAMVLKERHG